MKIFGKIRTLGEFWKTNFELLAGNWRNVGNLEKIFEEFLTDYVEVFWTLLWNVVKISKNCWKNYGVNVELILGKLWGNVGVILYYWFCGNYKEILKMLSYPVGALLFSTCSISLLLFYRRWSFLWHFFFFLWSSTILLLIWREHKSFIPEIKNNIRYSMSHKKGYIHFCRPTPRSLKNGYTPKSYFSRLFWKILFFSKKLFNEKYLKPTRKVILILSPDALFPPKRSCPSTNIFSQFHIIFKIFRREGFCEAKPPEKHLRKGKYETSDLKTTR